MYINENTINIKIPIKTNEYLRDFIFKNINMRRCIWNDFVEEANKYINEYNDYEFKPLRYKTEYFKMEEEVERYFEYCLGLSEQVAIDVNTSIKSIKTHNKKVFKHEIVAELARLHFQKRNNYYGSFKVGCKPTLTPIGNISNRIKVINKNTLSFRVRGTYAGREAEYITLELLEDLYDEYDGRLNQYIRFYKESGITNECRFDGYDIKQISFIHHLGKFYIQLSVNVKYCIDKDNVKSRLYKKAGIDTGIHNPIVIYDGENTMSLRMSDKICNKIHYLERRIRRIQSVTEKKIYGSNNYNRLCVKLRKLYYKITCIKKNWSYNICKFIVTRYKKYVWTYLNNQVEKIMKIFQEN